VYVEKEKCHGYIPVDSKGRARNDEQIDYQESRQKCTGGGWGVLKCSCRTNWALCHSGRVSNIWSCSVPRLDRWVEKVIFWKGEFPLPLASSTPAGKTGGGVGMQKTSAWLHKVRGAGARICYGPSGRSKLIYGWMFVSGGTRNRT
jgi:hypothetical protein